MSMNVVDVGTPPDGLKSKGWTTAQWFDFMDLVT